MISLANTRESLQEYHKAQSGDLPFSIFLLMIYFLVLINQSYVIHSYDDNTLYTSGNDANDFIKWFYENFMILNPDKCYFLTISECPTQFFL